MGAENPRRQAAPRAYLPLRPRGGTAFTLVELLVAMVISSMMFIALAVFARSSLTTTGILQDKNLAEHTARVALARFTREAALAKAVAVTGPHQFSFTCSDITGDEADDVVVYKWNANTGILARELNGVTETFAENVDLFSLEYQYETENQVTVVEAGDTLGMTLGHFGGYTPGAGEDVEDVEIDSHEGTSIRQYFNSLIEVPAATSVTIRARTKVLPPPVDMYIGLQTWPEQQTVAQGWLYRSQLTTTFQDVTVPLTWIGGAETNMVPDKPYRLYIRPGGSWPYWQYAGTVLYQRINVGPDLGGGLGLGYADWWWGARASAYFTVRGNLPITTPRRSTTPASVLKKIKATIEVTEGEHAAELSRTCKVLNQ